jgi:phospholipase D1/2
VSDESLSEASLLKPGQNCWRREKANRAALIVDACDYYRLALRAMLKARSQILLIGWDVDTRVTLTDDKQPEGAPTTLGPLLTWLSHQRPELNIYILAWDEGLLHVPGRGTTPFRMLRWAFDPKISIKWDSNHPLDGSHHQKILVIDDALAFCGGIDITGSRWDTRGHRDKEPGRRRPFTGRRYDPWHDATMAVDGDAACALGDLARVRWEVASRQKLPAAPRGSDPWPEELEPGFRDVDVAIARTRGETGPLEEIREIEKLFVDLIKCAKRFVYVETQYFASRMIAEAIASRLAEADGPEFVVLNPRNAWGWLDETVMSPARAELMKALEERDIYDRFRIYAPITEGGADIYVHAKIMIVDDTYLKVGSANMNNRSMGLDSECDVVIEGIGREDVRRRIAQIRTDLLAEHLAAEPAEVEACFAETGSIIKCIERLRGKGRTVVPMDPGDPGDIKKKIAHSEFFDPEGPGEIFERRTRPGLLSRLGRSRGRRGAG